MEYSKLATLIRLAFGDIVPGMGTETQARTGTGTGADRFGDIVPGMGTETHLPTYARYQKQGFGDIVPGMGTETRRIHSTTHQDTIWRYSPRNWDGNR